MSTIHKYVGLDVHKDTISIAVAEEGRSEPRFLKTIPSCTTKLLRILKQLGPLDKILCAYEAGPTGYWLQRFLTSKGIRCQVIAPSEVPTKPGRHVKTDRIDALAIAKFFALWRPHAYRGSHRRNRGDARSESHALRRKTC